MFNSNELKTKNKKQRGIKDSHACFNPWKPQKQKNSYIITWLTDWLKANTATSEKSRKLKALIWSKWVWHIKDTAAIFSSMTWVCDLNAFNGLLQIEALKHKSRL